MSDWPITLEEAGEALRQEAELLATERHPTHGVLVCQATQFPAAPRPPLQEEVERWVLAQGYRLSRATASP